MEWSKVIAKHLDNLPKIAANVALAQKVFHLIDLTSLNADDTEASIAEFCENATSAFGHVAGVCVNPKFVRLIAAQFANTQVKAITVANFPDGDQSLESVLIEIGDALQAGANEIDVVFPYKRFLKGDRNYATTFVNSCKAACGPKVKLKAILEIGAYPDYDTLANACAIALDADADFLKTATGKNYSGATLEAAIVMLTVIKEKQAELSKTVGFKAAGGIKKLLQAANYLAISDKIMGLNWATPETFRIGSSRLVNDLVIWE